MSTQISLPHSKFAIVSPEDFDEINKYKWYADKNYVCATFNNIHWRLHRYILIIILKNELTPKQYVDHINNNPLDNRRENLRIVTPSENSRNTKKRDNCSSIYKGVSKNGKKWQAAIQLENGKKIQAIYENELHAAYQYNLWLIEYKFNCVKPNDIIIPADFMLYKLAEKTKELPLGISSVRKRFRVMKGRKHVGYFDSLEEAIDARNKDEIETVELLENRRLNTPILRNIDGFCYIQIKESQVIVDENLYYDLTKYKWHIRSTYARSKINNKMIDMTRYVLNYDGDDIVDHINNNRLDNRKQNLRIVTAKQNSMNRLANKYSTSKYIGVAWFARDKLWQAIIRANGENIFLGRFKDEKDAAKARDEATKKYYGEYGNLNFPES